MFEEKKFSLGLFKHVYRRLEDSWWKQKFKLTQNCALRFVFWSQQRHISAIFASLQTWTKTSGAWKKVLPSKLSTAICILKSKIKQIYLDFSSSFHMINNFQETQTALFCKKSTFEIFKSNINRFLYLQGSGGQNKNKS